MKIEHIIPHMGNHTITVTGHLTKDDWDYSLESNKFEALRSESIGELSQSYGVVRYYPEHGSMLKSITVQVDLIKLNQFAICYEFTVIDNFLQIPAKDVQYAIKATIKKMFNANIKQITQLFKRESME